MKKTERKQISCLELIESVKDNDISKVKKLTDADIDIQDERGRTPLILAIYNNNQKIIKILIKSGANLNIQDEDGDTPLILAANYGFKDIVNLLIEYGTDINIKNIWKGNALTYAIENLQDEVVEILQSNGATVNPQLLLEVEKMGHDYIDRLKSAIARIQNSTPRSPSTEDDFKSDIHRAAEILHKLRLKD